MEQPPTPTSPFAAILAWSQEWPNWQRDALRRIVSTGSLTAEDIVELSHMCRAKNGLKPPKGVVVPVPRPLSDIPGGTGGVMAVSLKRLSGLQHVGRIPSDQRIEFGVSPGLTVIYGDNGAGKSGYARVIKKACRARGPIQEIKPDAFAPPRGASAEARIEYRVGSVDTPIDWKDGSPSDPRLSNIFVFDHFSARAHVNEDGPASFKPQGLDVLPELARACRQIGGLIELDADSLAEQISAARIGWTFRPTTVGGTLVATLSASTSPATINAVATFNEQDEKRLTEIVSTLAADPKIKAADTSAAAARIRTFCERADRLAIAVNDEKTRRVREAIERASLTAQAASLASAPELDAADLPGTFNAAWLKLWDAAREFSVTSAYREKDHPNSEPGARCVLCQQTLQQDAINRYQRFDDFVRNETRAQAEGARAEVSALSQEIRSHGVSLPDAVTIEADLDREAAGTSARAAEYAKSLTARLAHLQGCLSDGAWRELSDLPASPTHELIDLAVALERRAKNELSAADPVKAKLLEAERDELEDKKLLTEKKSEVLSQIDRLKLASALQACRDDCTTNTITMKSGELEEAYVTSAFRSAFKAELMELGMKTLPVRLEEGKPIPGQRRHGVRLQGMAAKPNGDPLYKVEEIASEGEQRCIALAGFLAELSQASHKSALVFDDPVSSLDHLRRAKVAKRLVKEAAIRQVIIFTHDVVFLCELFEAIEESHTPVTYWHVFWNGGVPGHTAPGLPWDWQGYADRIDALEKEQRRLAKSWSTVANDGNIRDMRTAYTNFSATLERVVQDVLLANVIGRYRGYVRIENLADAAGLSTKECAEMIRLHRRTSEVTGRHDPAAARAAPVPEPADLLQDIQSLKSLIEQVKARRKPSTVVLGPAAGASNPSGTASPVIHNN
jgi:hypothetical protein